MTIKKLLITCIFLTTTIVNAQVISDPAVYHINKDTDFIYIRPKRPFEFVENAPGNFLVFSKDTFQKKNIPTIAAIGLLTGVLIHFDQKIIDESQCLGEKLNISQKDHTRTFISTNGIPLFRGPTDTGSWLYFIGDGWTHISIAGSFYAYGNLNSDNRALQTSYQLFEGLICVGISTQFIKRITGRESPEPATAPGGKWRFFPNPNKYSAHVSAYDAFPSGHLAAATVTYVVIAENYPEYKCIPPIGYTLLTLLSFGMMNNGVHWASDYPLAIGLGYSFARIVINNHRTVVKKESNSKFHLLPVMSEDFNGLGLQYDF